MTTEQIVACEWCKRSLLPKAHRGGETKRYCGAKCREAARYLRHRDPAIERQTSLCASCSLPVTQITQRGRAKKYCSVRCRDASWRHQHREELRGVRAGYRAANPESAKRATRAWRAANRERVAATMRAWRFRNLERANAINRAWRLAHPAEYLSQSIRRRARKAGAAGSHTTQEWLEKLQLFASLCAYCGEASPLAREHKVPLVRGGSDDIANIVPACGSCNSRKGIKTATEFLAVVLQ